MLNRKLNSRLGTLMDSQ